MRDEKTGKLFMRTASGNWVELPDDLQVYTDPVTGKIFLGQPPPREIVLFLKCFNLQIRAWKRCKTNAMNCRLLRNLFLPYSIRYFPEALSYRVHNYFFLKKFTKKVISTCFYAVFFILLHFILYLYFTFILFKFKITCRYSI